MTAAFHLEPRHGSGHSVVRETIDKYAILAQTTAIFPILLVAAWSHSGVFFRVISRLFHAQQSARIPTKGRSSKRQLAWFRINWWLQTRVSRRRGSRIEWIFGIVWGSWLSFLCLKDTHLDYLHLTKRIGAVAVSQLPLCLLLATKSKFSPLQIILGLSEQHLNSYHRILARLITCFVACHVALYVNFFIWNGLLSKRIRDADVLIGIAASCFLVIIGITCLETLRHRNYRVFFITHTVLGGLLFPLLYFHTHHLRPYMLESIAVYAANSLARYFNTRSLLARITFTPSSDLHVLIHLPGGETEASRYPTATHIYLGIPSQTSPVLNFLRKTLVKNPFTIANSPSDKALNLLIRPRDGVTARFAEMDIPNSSSPGLESMTPVLVEGPYGLSTKFTPSISAHLWETYDNVLFCAGGLGATFIMPTVMALLNQNEMREDGPRVKVKVILIMRTQREVDTILELFSKPEPGGSEACRTNLRDVLQIFLTRPSYDMEEDYSHATDLQSLLPEHGSHSIPLTTYQPNGEAHLGRPNWVRLLDEFFKNGRSQETTAVLSCGPDDMKIELRDTLELFVKDGMKIWWCEEKFGR